MTMGKERQGVIIKGEGLCPRCGGAGSYRYEIRGYTIHEGSIHISFEYEFYCPFCGYKEKARVQLPLKAAYYIRHLLHPQALVEIERVWHASKLKASLGE